MIINMNTACACVGPIGNCPCIRKNNGETLRVDEIQISKEVFDYLSDDEKRKINDLKQIAINRYLISSFKS